MIEEFLDAPLPEARPKIAHDVATPAEGMIFLGDNQMQFLLMCCFEETAWMKLPDAERGRIMDQYGRLIQELKTSGQLLSGAKLDESGTAVTVRATSGRPLVTDGPFAETKEQLGGYHVVECRDRAEAISIAARIPTLAAGGTIEVRQILHAE